MPLDAIRCASAKLERQGKVVELTPHACLEHALDREADCGLTAELLGAMFASRGGRTTDNISTTALIHDCTRSVVLERTEPYTVDPRRLYPAFRGTMAHSVLETYRRPAPSWGERRLWMNHPFEPGRFIGCQPDLVDPDKGMLWDYKSKKNLPKAHWRTPYPRDMKQLQLNRLIIDNADWVEPIDKEPGEYLGPVPLRTTKDGTEYGPNPRWLQGEELEKLRPSHYGMSFEHLYITYFDFEGSVVLEAKESVEVPKNGGGTRRVYKPWVMTDDEVLGAIEPAYWALKEGLADPVNHLPDIPDALKGWPLDERSPCSWCDVRLQCMRRAGVPV